MTVKINLLYWTINKSIHGSVTPGKSSQDRIESLKKCDLKSNRQRF